MLADIDFRTLVGLAIVFLGLLSQLFGRRKIRGDSEEVAGETKRPSSGGVPPDPVPRPGSLALPNQWQKEIEALLRGDQTVKSPVPPRPVFAPPVIPSAPPPIPTDLGRFDDPEPVPLPVPPRLQVGAEDDIESRPAPTQSLSSFEASTRVYQRAAMLHARVAEHMHRTDEQTTHPGLAPATVRHEATPEVAALLTSLRSPRTARQAILAATVLGPPVGLAGPLGG